MPLVIALIRHDDRPKGSLDTIRWDTYCCAPRRSSRPDVGL